MPKKLDKQQMVELIYKLLASREEEEASQYLSLLGENLSHPEISGLIYWPTQYGLSNNPSPEEIIEKALEYKPTQL